MNFIPYQLTSVFAYPFHTYTGFEWQSILETESSLKDGQSKIEQALHLVENGNNLLSTEVSFPLGTHILRHIFVIAVSDKSESS